MKVVQVLLNACCIKFSIELYFNLAKNEKREIVKICARVISVIVESLVFLHRIVSILKKKTYRFYLCQRKMLFFDQPKAGIIQYNICGFNWKRINYNAFHFFFFFFLIIYKKLEFLYMWKLASMQTIRRERGRERERERKRGRTRRGMSGERIVIS